jgi:hypothetical protein
MLERHWVGIQEGTKNPEPLPTITPNRHEQNLQSRMSQLLTQLRAIGGKEASRR